MKSKRGVSDVIATILVVLITVVAAGILLSFVLPFVQKNLDSGSECLKYKDYLKFAPELKYTCYDVGGLHGFSVRAATLSEGAPNNTQQFKYHSADYDEDWKINDTEKDRAAEYIVNGEEYHIDTSSIDGYAFGPGNQQGSAHSADYNKDWRIDVSEVMRVNEYWNYKINGNRTGHYHIVSINSTQPDGYAPGPGQVTAVGEGENTNLKGFEVRLSNEQTSVKASVYTGNSSSSAVGGVRVLDRAISVIAVPRDGETQTYVYSSGGERYDKLEVFPVLQSGKICDRTDVIEISTCRGVSLA